MTKYEFSNELKAHGFHAEAKQYGPARIEYCTAGVWFVYVSPRFDQIVDARRAA
jgi:hypothetical protein